MDLIAAYVCDLLIVVGYSNVLVLFVVWYIFVWLLIDCGCVVGIVVGFVGFLVCFGVWRGCGWWLRLSCVLL